jgi:hypothetical protein
MKSFGLLIFRAQVSEGGDYLPFSCALLKDFQKTQMGEGVIFLKFIQIKNIISLIR